MTGVPNMQRTGTDRTGQGEAMSGDTDQRTGDDADARRQSCFPSLKGFVIVGAPAVVLVGAGVAFSEMYLGVSHTSADVANVITAATSFVAAFGLGFAILAVWLQYEELQIAMNELRETKAALKSQADTMQYQADLALTTTLIQSKTMLAEMYSQVLPTSGAVKNTHIPSYLAELDKMSKKERWEWRDANKNDVASQLSWYLTDTKGIHDSLARTAHGVLDRLSDNQPRPSTDSERCE
jgi:hypothetical protein